MKDEHLSLLIVIRGLFFFQPPMGYKKRQIDIT